MANIPEDILMVKTVSLEGVLFSVCPHCHKLCDPNEGIMRHLQTHNGIIPIKDKQLNLSSGNISASKAPGRNMKPEISRTGATLTQPGATTVPSLKRMDTKENNTNLSKTLSIQIPPHYTCYLCSKEYDSESGIRRHMRTEHKFALTFYSAMKKYTCINCKTTVKHEGNLAEHYIICTKKRKVTHECVHCHSTYLRKWDLVKHINKCHMWLVCSTCKGFFKTTQQLAEHNEKEHCDSRTSLFGYVCIDCETVFPKGEMLERHLLSKCSFRMTSWKCKICNAFFKCKCLLFEHTRKCQSGSEEIKQKCDKSSTSGGIEKSNTPENPSSKNAHLWCWICRNAKFESKSALFEHTRKCRPGSNKSDQTSSKKSSLFCWICGKLFRWSTELEKHVDSVHSSYANPKSKCYVIKGSDGREKSKKSSKSEDPSSKNSTPENPPSKNAHLWCWICRNAKFDSKSSLLEHTKKCRPDSKKSSKSDKTSSENSHLFCWICRKLFRWSSELEKHINSEHSCSADPGAKSLYRMFNPYSKDNSSGHHGDFQPANHDRKHDLSVRGIVAQPKDGLMSHSFDRTNSKLCDGVTSKLPIEIPGYNTIAKDSGKSNDDTLFVRMQDKPFELAVTKRGKQIRENVSEESQIHVSTEETVETEMNVLLEADEEPMASGINVSTKEPQLTPGLAKKPFGTKSKSYSPGIDNKAGGENGHGCQKRQKSKLHKGGPSSKCKSLSLGVNSKGGILTQSSTLHICQHCQKTFQRKTMLTNHLKYCLRIKTYYQCLHCDSTHTLKEHLVRHIRQVHLWIPCTNCATAFQSKGELEIHMKTEHSTGSPITGKFLEDVDVTWKQHDYMCMDCQTIFRNRELIESHLLTKCNLSGRKCSWCLRCNSNFKCKCYLLQHIQQTHLAKGLDIAHPSCPLCLQVFASGHVLTQHMFSVHFNCVDKMIGSSPRELDGNRIHCGFESSEERPHQTESGLKDLTSEFSERRPHVQGLKMRRRVSWGIPNLPGENRRTRYVSNNFRKYPSLRHLSRCSLKSSKPLKIWQQATSCSVCHRIFSKRHLNAHIRKRCQNADTVKLMREHNYANRKETKVPHLESNDFSDTIMFKCSMCDRHYSVYGSVISHFRKVHPHVIEQTPSGRKTKKGNPTIIVGKEANRLKRSSQCLMCGHWFHQIEAHLWECQAKRPCLNKIIEVYTEVKEELSDDNEQFTGDCKHHISTVDQHLVTLGQPLEENQEQPFVVDVKPLPAFREYLVEHQEYLEPKEEVQIDDPLDVGAPPFLTFE